MQKDYTRDVSEKMIEALNEPEENMELNEENKHIGVFFPFVDFVRKNKELALCFRGNDTKEGKVMIYKNNHLIWELYLAKNEPVVRISENHARFMEDWQEEIKKLMDDWGFKGPTVYPTYKSLYDNHAFIKKHKAKDGFTYDMVKLSFRPSDEHKLDEDFVKETFAILDRMQNSFFSKEYTEKNPPINHFKQYYLEDKKKYIARPQKCLEKHVQQELFLNNHKFKDGLFVYDLEFAQPSIPNKKVPNDNKPDMFALRFDEKGNMVAICMVEVKSTASALTSGSGLKEHLKGMVKYINNRELMGHRTLEACNIMNQYHTLKLYEVEREYSIEEFEKIKKEIIFVFSNGLDQNNFVDEGETVKDVLITEAGYSFYKDKIIGGKHSDNKIVALIKEYS